MAKGTFYFGGLVYWWGILVAISVTISKPLFGFSDPFASVIPATGFEQVSEKVLDFPIFESAFSSRKEAAGFLNAIQENRKQNARFIAEQLEGVTTLREVCGLLKLKKKCLSQLLTVPRLFGGAQWHRRDYEGAIRLRHSILSTIALTEFKVLAQRTVELVGEKEIHLSFHPKWFLPELGEKKKALTQVFKNAKIELRTFVALNRDGLFSKNQKRVNETFKTALECVQNVDCHGLSLGYTSLGQEEGLSSWHSLERIASRWRKLFFLSAKHQKPLWLSGLHLHPHASFLIEALNLELTRTKIQGFDLVLTPDIVWSVEWLQRFSNLHQEKKIRLLWDSNDFGILESHRVRSSDWEDAWESSISPTGSEKFHSADFLGMRLEPSCIHAVAGS
jgi:hypothetical protein